MFCMVLCWYYIEYGVLYGVVDSDHGNGHIVSNGDEIAVLLHQLVYIYNISWHYLGMLNQH